MAESAAAQLAGTAEAAGGGGRRGQQRWRRESGAEAGAWAEAGASPRGKGCATGGYAFAFVGGFARGLAEEAGRRALARELRESSIRMLCRPPAVAVLH